VSSNFVNKCTRYYAAVCQTKSSQVLWQTTICA